MSWSSVISGLAPSSWWRMGETTGNLSDSGSGGKTMSWGGFLQGLTYSQTSLVASDTSNKAIKFDGADVSGFSAFLGADYYDVAGTTAFSVLAVIKPDGSGGGATRRILEKIATNGWRVALSSSDKILFQRITSSGTTTVTGATTISSGSTYVVLCTYDGTNMRIYVNGSLDAGPTASSFSMDNTTGVVSLGCTSGRFGCFGGTLDEIAFWDGTGLSSTNAADIYTASLPATPPNGTIALTGTLDGYTLGSDSWGAITGGFTKTSGDPPTSLAVERSTDNSTWVDVTANCTVTITASGAVFVDKRPDQGSQAATYGSTIYYRVKASNSGGAGSYTSSANRTATAPDQAAVKAKWAASTRGHMLARTEAGGGTIQYAVPSDHYTTYGQLQIGQYLGAMAEAALMSQTVSNWATNGGPTLSQCVAMCQAQWDYIKWQVANKGNGKFCCTATEGSETSPTYAHIDMDSHFRPIMHSLMAARLLAFTGDATALALAADIRSCGDDWIKNAFDYLNSGSPTYSYTWKGWDADNQTAWQASHAYSVGALVRPTSANTRSYRCMTAGTSSGSQPTWPTTTGGTVTDGTVVWKETSRVVTKFKYWYNNNGTTFNAPDTDADDAGATIVNKELAICACLTLVLEDCASFNVAGARRTTVLDYVAGVVDWVCSVFSTSDGGFPYAVYTSPPSTGKATVYQSFNISLLAIIAKYGRDTSNQWQTGPVIDKAMDYLESVFSSEPYSRVWVDGSSSALQGMSELGFARAGYYIRNRTYPFDTVMFTRAFNDPTAGDWAYYSRFGGGTAYGGVSGSKFNPLDQFQTQDAIITSQIISAGIATETDTGLGATPSTSASATIGIGAETDTGLGATPSSGATPQSVSAGVGTEDDSGLTATPSGGASNQSAAIGVGSETDTGITVTPTSSSGAKATIIRETYVTSDQFGSKTVESDTFGERTTHIHPESTIS